MTDMSFGRSSGSVFYRCTRCCLCGPLWVTYSNFPECFFLFFVSADMREGGAALGPNGIIYCTPTVYGF